MIVLAQGWKPGQPFSGEEKAIPESFTEKIVIIGDAEKPGRISEAVNDAFHAAMTLKEGNDV